MHVAHAYRVTNTLTCTLTWILWVGQLTQKPQRTISIFSKDLSASQATHSTAQDRTGHGRTRAKAVDSFGYITLCSWSPVYLFAI